MPKGVHLDLDRIHRGLWEKSDRLHRVRINQIDLAEDLGISKFATSRLMARLVGQQRLRQVSSTRQKAGLFVVEEPDEWQRLYADSW